MSLHDSQEPLVSVIIPTYNRVDFLPFALHSVIQQTYRHLEIIVVDDGSTDNTAAIIQQIQAENLRDIKYVYQSNAGCSSARNHGIKESHGQLIALLDSDDRWFPQTIEKLVARLLDSQADMVFSPAVERYKTGKSRVNIPVSAEQPDQLAYAHFLSSNVRNGSLLFKREIFERLGYYRTDLKHNEDSDFLQRAAIHFQAAYLNFPTVEVFHHTENKSLNRPAIYEALLVSSETILHDYPVFRHQIGKLGKKRIEEIRHHLLYSLIKRGEAMRAKQLAEQWGDSLPLDIQFALWRAKWLTVGGYSFFQRLFKRQKKQ